MKRLFPAKYSASMTKTPKKDAPVEDYSIALATVIETVFGPVYR